MTIPPKKRILPLLALSGLVLGALLVRLLVFKRYLPLVDWGDELNMYTLARHWRGVEDFHQNNERLLGYPPLYIWISMGVQQIVEQVTTGWVAVGGYIYPMRLIAAVAGALTTGCIIASGWMLGGPVTGWLAGLIWAFSPVIVPYETLAIPDTLLFLATAGSIAAAICAWQAKSFRWATVSLIAGILGVYLKYSSVVGLIPWGVVTLALLIRLRRKSLPWLIVQAGVAALLIGYLIWGYGMFRIHNEQANAFRDVLKRDGPLGVFRQPGNRNNYHFSLEPFRWHRLFYGGLIAGGVALGMSWWRRWRTVEWRAVPVLAVYSAGTIFVVSSHTTIWEIDLIRYVLPVTLALILIWAMAITQVTYALGGLLARVGRGRLLLSNGLVAVLTMAFFVPSAIDLSAVIDEFHRQDTRVDLWRWSDGNVPPDGMILVLESSSLDDAWNRPWRGYDGVTSFQWWIAKDFTEETPAGWWERGIAYFAFTDADRLRWQQKGTLDAVNAELDDMLLLAHLAPKNPAKNGPREIWFYRMIPPQVQTDFVLGEQIRLSGYDLDVSGAQPGGEIDFRPYWNALRTPDANYSMFVHLYTPDSRDILAQTDGPPTNAFRLTLTWTDPGETLIGADMHVAIPADLTPGEYRLAVGLYDWQTYQRLMLPDGADFVDIPVTIEPIEG
jgi:4-amino-4-deoxy-L-arabinose transferase-like glycosyltransferase